MKKTIGKIIACVLTLCLLCAGLIGCGGSSWDGTSMKNWGEGDIVGGFVGQTSNYVYFINGSAEATGDNEFGVPVKGALMAVDKSDLSKAEVVVPKLFASTDYNAGIYVYGDYVYYGTPNTEKNSSGNVANDELIMTKSKLDGTETEQLFNIGGLSSEYRVVEVSGKVYVVYYDAKDTALYSYDVNSGEKTVIAKTDATVPGVGATSLSAYTFLDNESVKNGYVVAYTTAVFSEDYFEEKAEKEGYQRALESYNKLFVYKAGATESTLVADGKDGDVAYETVSVKDGYLFYKGIDANAKEENHVSFVCKGENKAVEKGINSSVVGDGVIFVGLDEIYTLESTKVYKTTAYKADATKKEVVAIAENAHELLFVLGDYVYYHSNSGYIARIALNDETAEEQVVTDGSISHDWFDASVMNVNGKDYLFYLDTSADGASYVEYVDLNSEVKEEKDDDGNTVKWYLDGQELLGKMTDSDKAGAVQAKIEDLASDFSGGKIVLEEEKGVLVNKDIEEVRAIVNELSPSVKDKISSDVLALLGNYEKAIEKANVYNKLKDMRNYATLSDEDQLAVKAIYDQVKGTIEEFRNSSDYSAVVSFIDANYLNLYQSAVEVFEAK